MMEKSLRLAAIQHPYNKNKIYPTRGLLRQNLRTPGVRRPTVEKLLRRVRDS
jgi:hypothetical protein